MKYMNNKILIHNILNKAVMVIIFILSNKYMQIKKYNKVKVNLVWYYPMVLLRMRNNYQSIHNQWRIIKYKDKMTFLFLVKKIKVIIRY